MKKIYWILITLVLVAACGKGEIKFRGGGGDPSQDQPSPKTMRDQTNMSLCQGSPPANAELQGETWNLQQTAGNMQQIQTLFIQGNGRDPSTTTTSLTVTCSSGTFQGTVAVHALSTFDGQKLYHQSAAPQEVGNKRIGKCTASLDDVPSAYALTGSCLKIYLNGQLHYFVRQ